MGKLKILTNQLAMLYRQNAPKNFMFSIIILIQGYRQQKKQQKTKTKKKHVKKLREGEKD